MSINNMIDSVHFVMYLVGKIKAKDWKRMMGKKDHRRLLELLANMEEAYTLLVSWINDNSEASFINLLTNMQEIAIELGTKIEELLGEGTEIVQRLEALCETIWNCSQHQSDIEREELIIQMELLMTRAREEIEKLPITYEVVFLPYKASMWDSMESVWRAAMEDTQCTCYVIPIPYYDKNADGTFGDKHYEGDLFPDYVPVTDHSSYSLIDNKPDILYFHNPYDQFNHVTSVDPQYYSRELKKHTDMLVYIPYYCTNGYLAEGHEQFVSYHIADKIIVQNDNIRENLLQINKTLPQDKVVALGSPKFDRMLYLDQNKPEIPVEWKETISGKKTFLYNTSISSILNDGDKLLDKMESIFEVFHDRRDVILIWRPHPLLRSTLNSMRQGLAERYDRLVHYFLEEKIGILDVTPDVNKTIAIADAYIGEGGSSVVPLAGVIGKPIFITAREVYKQHSIEELSMVEFMDCAVEDNYVWFVDIKYHRLCQMDTRTGKIEVLGKIPESEGILSISYIDIVKYQDRLIMIPNSATGICEYSLTTRQFSKYYFRKEDASFKFGRVVQYKNDLYLLPQEYPAILRYNLDTRVISYYYECIEDMRSRMDKRYGWAPFVWGACTYENLLFLASAWSNHLMIFNMNTDEYEICEVGEENNLYRGIVADKMYCWLIQQGGKSVVRWNRITNETIEYDKYPEGFISGNIIFKNIIKIDDKLYLIPFNANHIITMDVWTGHMECMEWDNNDHNSAFDYNGNDLMYHFGKKLSEYRIGAYQLFSQSYIEIDVINGIQKKSLCQFKKSDCIDELVEMLVQIRQRDRYSPFTVIENKEDLMVQFIEYVKADRHNKEDVRALYEKITKYADGSSGTQIHKYIESSCKL